MTPEQLVPSRETCERLKAAGFQQNAHFRWNDNGGGVYEIRCDECGYGSGTDAVDIAAPTAAELMDALPQSIKTKSGEWTMSLYRHSLEFYIAHYEVQWSIRRADDERMAEEPVLPQAASTAAEALALLWLKVKEKP